MRYHFSLVRCNCNDSDKDNNGIWGGPSSSCEDPIVPTNCIETSRATVCGVEAVGRKQRGICCSGLGAFLNDPGTG